MIIWLLYWGSHLCEKKIYVILGGYNGVRQRHLVELVVDTAATTPANIALKSNGFLFGIGVATD